jgi:hypothetical protein
VVGHAIVRDEPAQVTAVVRKDKLILPELGHVLREVRR